MQKLIPVNGFIIKYLFVHSNKSTITISCETISSWILLLQAYIFMSWRCLAISRVDKHHVDYGRYSYMASKLSFIRRNCSTIKSKNIVLMFKETTRLRLCSKAPTGKYVPVLHFSTCCAEMESQYPHVLKRLIRTWFVKTCRRTPQIFQGLRCI